VVEYIVEDFDWAVLDHYRVCSKSFVQEQRLFKEIIRLSGFASRAITASSGIGLL